MKPMSKLKTEYKPEIIRQYIKQQVCWICGKGGWMALSQHLVKKHGLPAAEVREMAYMFKCERLISEELSENLSKVALIKFGKRRHIPLVGVKQLSHVLSKKARDMMSARVEIIRPLAGISQQKRRKPHYCKVCGKLIKTSKPRYCSPECTKAIWSEKAKKAMTPERIVHFRSIIQRPTPEQQSAAAKKMWKAIKSWPIDQQKAYFAKRAESRKSPLINVPCVICGTEFTIPIYRLHGKRRTTCSQQCSKTLMIRIRTGRKHTPEAIKKMSIYAIERHKQEGSRFGHAMEVKKGK